MESDTSMCLGPSSERPCVPGVQCPEPRYKIFSLQVFDSNIGVGAPTEYETSVVVPVFCFSVPQVFRRDHEV